MANVFSIIFLAIFHLYFNLINCAGPIRIESRISNGTCPSEVETSELSRIIEQELKNRYGLPCDNSSSRPTLVTELFGQEEGSLWDDYVPCHTPVIIGIRQIDVGYDESLIQSIKVTYLLADRTTYTAPKHGNGGSSTFSIVLNENERITYMGIESNEYAVTQLTFRSTNSDNLSTTHGPFGQTGSASGQTDGYILSFRGYSTSSALHSLSAYFLPPVFKDGPSGGSCRNSSYDDKVDTLIPPVLAISSIVIGSGSLIDSIQATYMLLDGSLYLGKHMGGSGGTLSNVTFKENEIITYINGSSFETYLGVLNLQTTFQDVQNYYGPYGADMTIPFAISHNILGFFGFADYHSGIPGDILCSIGVYYTL